MRSKRDKKYGVAKQRARQSLVDSPVDQQEKEHLLDALLFYIEIKTEVQIKNNNKLKRRIELIVHLLRSKRDKKYGVAKQRARQSLVDSPVDQQEKEHLLDALLFYIEIKTEVQIKNNNKLKRRIELIVHMAHGRVVACCRR